ncbi:hypothetical protein PR048_018214 [Dryococelus australis]|uniref:Ion transport domain-containing protein n=1 Tax=Dryococelus australis TaxID=614101 RepID=A0ABQ9HBP5_9NEOP|nr:hypothetical protein PR048_018214 [Dryococelus australis]
MGGNVVLQAMCDARQLERCGSICMPDPYEELLSALNSRDVDRFHRLLARGDVANPDHTYGHRGSCLYMACALDDGAPFVEALMKHGADPNLVNAQLKRAPVHVAAAKGNIAVLNALLSNNNLDVNVLDKFGDTAFHIAAKQLADDWGRPDEFVVVLLEQTDVDANLPNRQDYTGVHLVAQKACRNTLENILRLTAADLDTYKSPVDEKTARQTIVERFPNLELPQLEPGQLSQNKAKTTIFKHLRRRDTTNFQSALEDALRTFGDGVMKWNDGNFTLLQYASIYGLAEEVEIILNMKFDPNFTIQTNPKAPIILACKKGFYKILEKFVSYQSMSEENKINFYDFDGRTSVLHSVINGKKWSTVTSPEQDFDKCLDIILEHISTLCLEIDSVDGVGNTALHYAAKHQYSDVVSRLLANGAYIGTKDKFGEPPLANIELDVLENFLNSCIKESKNQDHSANDFEVELNYENLVPPIVKALCKRTITNSNNSKGEKSLAMTPECLLKRRGSEYSVIINDIDKKPLNSPITHEIIFKTSIEEKNKEYLKNPTPEIEPLLYIGRSKQLRHLLMHPVFSSFMYLKWQSFQYFFYVNLFLYLLFVILLSIFILCDYGNFTDQASAENVFQNHTVLDDGLASSYSGLKVYIWGFIVLLELLLIARETFQLLVSPMRYFQSPENYMELLLVVITSIIIFVDVRSQNIRTNLSAYGILLSYAELVLLLGRHPKLSTNIEMLKRVSFNFLRFLAWYSSLLLAFSLSFYILFRNSNSSKSGDDGEENFFLNPGMSMLKTVVMMTGEFDASSLPFESLPVTSQLMFILFVFLIALVLLNLLNGLAVSDTQAIKNDAEIVSLVSRVQLIYHFESMMLGNPLSWLSPLCRYCCCIPDERYLGFIFGISRKMFHRVSIFPYMTPNFKAYVLQNQDYQVTFLSQEERQAQQVKYISEVSVGKLDPQIIKSAVLLLSHTTKLSEIDCVRQIMEQNQKLLEHNKQMMQDMHQFIDESRKRMLENQQILLENVNILSGNRRLIVESQRMIDVDN